MNVVQRTADRLVIRERPWLEGFVGLMFLAAGLYAVGNAPQRLFGASFAALGAGVLLWVARVVTCTFDRERGLFIRTSRGVLGSSEIEKPLSDIVGVWVQLSSGRSTMFRVELAMRSGDRVALTGGSSGRSTKERIAADIRSFLNLPTPEPAVVPTFGEVM